MLYYSLDRLHLLDCPIRCNAQVTCLILLLFCKPLSGHHRVFPCCPTINGTKLSVVLHHSAADRDPKNRILEAADGWL